MSVFYHLIVVVFAVEGRGISVVFAVAAAVDSVVLDDVDADDAMWRDFAEQFVAFENCDFDSNFADYFGEDDG